MKLMFQLIINAFLLALCVVARPLTDIDIVKRDDFVPPILTPRAGAVWTSGDWAEVTWNTTGHPVNITNPVGYILLRLDDLTTPLILASGFDILDGKVGFRVPDVLEYDSYCVVLFGDSGNFSPLITITGSGIQGF